MNDSWDDFVSGIAGAGIEGKVVKDRRKVLVKRWWLECPIAAAPRRR